MGVLDGRIVLVTGAGSGIGRGVVDAIVAEGAKVASLELWTEKVEALRADHPDDRGGLEGDATSREDNDAVGRGGVGPSVESPR